MFAYRPLTEAELARRSPRSEPFKIALVCLVFAVAAGERAQSQRAQELQILRSHYEKGKQLRQTFFEVREELSTRRELYAWLADRERPVAKVRRKGASSARLPPQATEMKTLLNETSTLHKRVGEVWRNSLRACGVVFRNPSEGPTRRVACRALLGQPLQDADLAPQGWVSTAGEFYAGLKRPLLNYFSAPSVRNPLFNARH